MSLPIPVNFSSDSEGAFIMLHSVKHLYTMSTLRSSAQIEVATYDKALLSTGAKISLGN